MRIIFLTLSFLALLASCNAPNNQTAVEEPTTMTEERIDDMEDDPTATLNATVDAVNTYNGDLTAIPAGTAVSTIDAWMESLDDIDGTEKVTGNLELLKDELTSGDINGPLAGMLLTTLAEDTRQAVGSRGNTATSALVSSLKSAGDKLTMAATSGSDLLSQTLAAVKGKAGDITTLPAAAAVSNIDSWIAKLGGVDGADEVVEELRSLRGELGQPRIDGEKVADILEDLSEDTEEIANGNAAVETLAYALKAGAYRLNGKR